MKSCASDGFQGGDYTVGILNGHALPAIKIETDREFYDYQAKYLDDDTRYLCAPVAFRRRRKTSWPAWR